MTDERVVLAMARRNLNQERTIRDWEQGHAELVDAIRDMHPAGVSPPHELGNFPDICAGCRVIAEKMA